MANRTERKLTSSGSRFVAIGAPLLVIGIVLALLLDHNSVGIGVAIAVLGAIPTVVGIALMLFAGVNQHAPARTNPSPNDPPRTPASRAGSRPRAGARPGRGRSR